MKSLTQKKSIWIPLAVMAVTGVLLLIYIFSGAPYHVYTKNPGQNETLFFSDPGELVEQVFYLPDQAESISAIMITFGREHGTSARGTATVCLYEDDVLIGQWTCNTRFLIDEFYKTFRLEKPAAANDGSTWRITISDDFEDKEYIGVGTSFYSDQPPIVKNGEVIENQSLSFRAVYTMTSQTQRVLFSFVIFLCAGMLCILFSLYPGICRRGYSKDITRIVWTCAVITMCLFAILYQHDDGTRITRWGIHFLDAVRNGQLRNYGQYLEEVYEISNYNVLVHLLTGVLVLPLYIVDRLFHLRLSIELFDYWRKIFLVLFLIQSADLIRKIGKELGFSEEIGNVLGILYMISPSALWGNLSLGQIDCISLYFILLFAYEMLKKRHERAFFWLSVSIVIKEFGLFFVAAPLFAAAAGRGRYKKIAACGAALFFLPVTSKILARTYFIDYAEYAAYSERDWGHIARLFDSGFSETSYFLAVLLIICFLCYYKARHSTFSAEDAILAGTGIAFAFQVFAHQNPQWILYTSLFLLLGSFYVCGREDILCLLPFFQIGAYLFCMFYFRYNSDTVLLKVGIVGQTFRHNDNFYSFYDYARWLFPGYYDRFTSVGKTLLSASIIAAFILFLRSRKRKELIDRNRFGDSRFLAVLVPLLFAIHFAVVISSFVMYFGLIIPY